MKHSERYFENRECPYYPCHEGAEHMNCLFCFCPLYHREDCPGNPKYVEYGGKMEKICTNCTFPHQPDNYDKVMEYLMEL